MDNGDNQKSNDTLPLFTGMPTGYENIESSNGSFEREVFDLVNSERKKNGLQNLIWNEDLARAARYHAAHMEHDDYFSHDSQDKNKDGSHVRICNSFQRIGKFGGGCGENIAAFQSSPVEVMEDWLDSPGHRDNILGSGFRSLGVGYVNGRWVQVFGY